MNKNTVLTYCELKIKGNKNRECSKLTRTSIHFFLHTSKIRSQRFFYAKLPQSNIRTMSQKKKECLPNQQIRDKKKTCDKTNNINKSISKTAQTYKNKQTNNNLSMGQ